SSSLFTHFSLMPRPPRSPLFPYTTLFRSLGAQDWLPLEVFWVGGVFALLGLLWALVRGIRQFRWPTEAEALDRLDRTLPGRPIRSEEHTSELQSRENLVCRLLLEKKNDP